MINNPSESQKAMPYLARLQLDKPSTWKDQMMRKMIVAELVAGGHIDAAVEAR